MVALRRRYLAMLALLVFDWLRLRRIPPLHAVSALLVLVLGAATLLLHNRLFIQWKPTVLFWVVSIAFVASSRIGERTLTQLFLEPALGGRVVVVGLRATGVAVVKDCFAFRVAERER